MTTERRRRRATVPPAALLLGIAGVLPFVWGAATDAIPSLFDYSLRLLGARFTGQYVLIFYGAVILSFMSGVLWGFATRAKGGAAARGYALSTLPALWTFFLVGGGETRATLALVLGFAGLLALDRHFHRLGLAPPWWMRLRVLLTSLVVACLVIGLVA